MTIKQYAKKVKKLIEEKGVNVTIIEAEKANGIVMTGIAYKNLSVSPTIYLDDMFRDNHDPDEAATYVMEMLEKYETPEGPMNDFIRKFVNDGLFSDYENVRPLLRARFYNKKTSADVSMSAEKYGFPDLIIVPSIVLDSGEDEVCGSIKVTSSHCNLWGVDKETVLQDAINNIGEPVLMRVEDLLPVPAELDFTMLVVTNKNRCFGASSVLTAFDRLKAIYPDGFVVIPSSLHEVIVTPIFEDHLSWYNDMIGFVNGNSLKPEEVLGENAYVFYPV